MSKYKVQMEFDFVWEGRDGLLEYIQELEKKVGLAFKDVCIWRYDDESKEE